MSDQHPATPVKPKLTPEQRGSLILDLEIKIDNARVALKTWKKERLDVQIRLREMDDKEAAKKKEIDDAEKALKALESGV